MALQWVGASVMPARPESVGEASPGCTWTCPQAAEAWFSWRVERDRVHPPRTPSSSPVLLPLLRSAQHPEGFRGKQQKPLSLTLVASTRFWTMKLGVASGMAGSRPSAFLSVPHFSSAQLNFSVL